MYVTPGKHLLNNIDRVSHIQNGIEAIAKHMSYLHKYFEHGVLR